MWKEELVESKTKLRVKDSKGIGRETGIATGAWVDVPHYEKYALLLTNRNSIRQRFNVMVLDHSAYYGHSDDHRFYLFPRMVSYSEAKAKFDELG